MDPLDGILDVNTSSAPYPAYKRVLNLGKPLVMIDDSYKCCNKQVAAGYIIYGSSTMLVYMPISQGVNGLYL